MLNNSWFKKEKPLPTMIGMGGGATGLGLKTAGGAGVADPLGHDASGGVISHYYDPSTEALYRAHTFTAPGDFVVSSLSGTYPAYIDWLIVAPGGGGGQQQRTGADLRLDIQVKFKEAAFGTEKEVDVGKHDSCGTCKGSGSKPGYSPKACRTCRGTGQVVRAQGFFSVQSTCPDCRGAGQTISHPCNECHGEGRVRINKKLSINIPAGVDDGSRLRLKGEGEQGPQGLPPGDLYVIIHVAQHEFFHREEDDIHCKMTLTFAQAALGADIEISLLEENQTKVISIPAGIQNNGNYRIRGAGITRLRGGGRGDQIIHFTIETPKNLNKRQTELYKELAEIDGHSFTDTLKGFFQKLKM